VTAPLNLDNLAAVQAQQVVDLWVQKGNQLKDSKNLENVVRKALGILQENGIFATVLYLLTRRDGEKSAADAILASLGSAAFNLTGKAFVDSGQQLEILKSVTESLTKDLDRLILVTELWEQTLIYARYAAAAVR
jgi:hypothetical protein